MYYRTMGGARLLEEGGAIIQKGWSFAGLTQLQITVSLAHAPSDKQSRNTLHFSPAAARMVGAKNMHSSSGWAVTTSTRPPARRPRVYPPVTQIFSQPSNTAKVTAIAATKNSTELIVKIQYYTPKYLCCLFREANYAHR